MKILSVFGTRPEAIKMAPLIKAFARMNKRFKALQEQLGKRQRQNDELQAQLMAQAQKAASAHAALSSAEAQRDSLRQDVESLRTQLTERTEELVHAHKRYETLQTLFTEGIKLIAAQQKDMHAAMITQEERLVRGFSADIEAIKKAQSAILRGCKREIDNALQQSVAYGGLRDYFASGELPVVTPWQRGWPASPDFMLWLVELIEQNDYDLIVEFGSGVTTLYTAKTLAARIHRKSSPKNVRVVSFEHQEEFLQKTRELLVQGRCEEILNSVSVIYAPLQPYTTPDGTTYQYYACEEHLSALLDAYNSPTSRILVTVDGPPGVTCKNARFPAFPQVMRYFASARIDFLLDDYGREDEKELAEKWQSACETAGLHISVAERACEKGAFLLSVHSA